MVEAVPVGRDYATQYERAVEPLLTALFYPALSTPSVQYQIHEGRKRIDITYTNVARHGFFYWLAMHYSAAHVFAECKNYSDDASNPELDQSSGRFSPSRGRFGLLLCRRFNDKELFIRRCIDTAHDHRGFIVPLDDTDLQVLVEERKRSNPIDSTTFRLIDERFRRLING